MTISGKLRRAFWGAGLVLIVNLVAVAGLMTIIKGNVRHMAERQMAAEAAVAGMIDAVEDGRRMVEMGAAGASVQTGEVPDLGAFPEHAKKFLELTQSSEQRTLGEQAQASYKEFATVRDQLIDANSKQLAAMKELEETGEIMHGVNRDKFLASIRKSTPYAQKKTDRVLEMDRSLELVANIVADYHRDPKPEAKDELAKALGEYEDAMVVYKRTGLYGDENEWYRQYRRTYTKFKDSARGVMDQEDARRKVLANFDKAYAAMSEILVDKLQPMVADDAVSTKSTALRLGDLTMAIALALAVAGIVFGFIGVRLVASEVNEDVAALVYATDQVGRGVLEYKVELSSKNELGEIQDGINRMIDQLVVVRDDKARQMSDMKDSVDKYRQIAEDVTQAHERRRRAEVL
ncbi:HAMP domain-containing protein, partial [bacterium]|nr:HAMP domain-containing protein [bacterium]